MHRIIFIYNLGAIFLISFFYLFLMSFAFSNQALAETCNISDPTDTALNVRATPNGKIINRLRNGREVNITRKKNDTKGRPWGYATGKYKGEFREWGWVFMEAIQCNDMKLKITKKSIRKIKIDYPVVINGDDQIKQFGLHYTYFASKKFKSKTFENKCFKFEISYGLSISSELIKKYKNRGLNFKQICAGFQIEELNFDPETGKKIPTYNVVNMDIVNDSSFDFIVKGKKLIYLTQMQDASMNFPLAIPDCFSTGKISTRYNVSTYPIELQNEYNTYNITDFDTKCEYNYDTRFGNKRTKTEKKMHSYFSSYIGQEQGEFSPDSVLISKKLKAKLKKRKTKAEVTAILNQQN